MRRRRMKRRSALDHSESARRTRELYLCAVRVWGV